jgi:hypothetical protein
MRLQLLAIVQREGASGESGGYSAVIYDPDSDRVLVAVEGEQLAGRTLRKIEAGRIELLDQGTVRRLSLRDDASLTNPDGRGGGG